MDNSNHGYKNMAIKTRTTVITTTTTPESLPKTIFDINRHRNINNNNNYSNNHQAVLNGKSSVCPKVDARPPFSLTSKHSSYLKFFSLPPSPPLLNFTTLYFYRKFQSSAENLCDYPLFVYSYSAAYGMGHQLPSLFVGL